jgi:hypothetical protein
MTLTKALQLKEKYLQYDDLRALDYCERRWSEEGRPTERWQLINFLEKMLREVKDRFGAYPKVLLLRKKELQRRTYAIPQPSVQAEGAECPCYGGWRLEGIPCPCPKGEPHRQQLRKCGMII